MQITLTELLGFFGIITSIATAVWLISDRFGKLEGRVGKLEEKVEMIDQRIRMIEQRIEMIEQKLEEVLFYLIPKSKRKQLKKLYRKR